MVNAGNVANAMWQRWRMANAGMVANAGGGEFAEGGEFENYVPYPAYRSTMSGVCM